MRKRNNLFDKALIVFWFQIKFQTEIKLIIKPLVII
jgi:hypothetical protein